VESTGFSIFEKVAYDPFIFIIMIIKIFT